MPININNERTLELANVFGCSLGSFPFTYLGLPLGTTKPPVKDFAPLICRIERRLSASSQFLTYAGRLQLVNSVISTLPTYFMCSLKLPVSVIDEIDKLRKNCLWRGNDFDRKGYNLVAWDLVMKPKNKGGLGVINLTLQNEALLLKQLDKFYKKKAPHLDREKGSFWWKDLLRLSTTYRGIAHCIPAVGDTVSLGNDLLLDSIFSIKFANLFEFSKNKSISLASAWSQDNLIDLFWMPMTRDAFNELQLVDTLNTRNVLRRRNKFLEEGYNCVMCDIGDEETIVHLFFHCKSARARWEVLGIKWPRAPDCYQKLIIARRSWPRPFFMEVFLIAAWCMWKERNML